MQRRFLLISGSGAALVASAAFAQTTPPAVPAVSVLTQWEGIGLAEELNAFGTGAIPPDMAGAVGPTHVVQFVNGGFAIYERGGKRVGKLRDDASFWRAAGISSNYLDAQFGLSDPRMIYDAASRRFFVSEITVNIPNAVLLAVSKTSDPTQGFRAVVIPLKAGVLGDFPTLGVNGSAVTLSTNNFGADTQGNLGFVDVSVFSVPKADLLLAKPSAANVSRFDSLPSADAGTPGTVEPLGTAAEHPARIGPDDVVTEVTLPRTAEAAATARTLAMPQRGKGYGFALQAVNSQNLADGSQGIYAISNTVLRQFVYSNIVNAGQPGAGISPPTTFKTAHDGFPGLGRQPAGPTYDYDNGDDRVSGTVKQVGNYVFLANTVGNVAGPNGTSTKNSVHFVVIDARAQKVVVDRLISVPSAQMDYSYPSIDSNGSQIVISYNGSGVKTNVSAYVTACNFDQTTLSTACSAPKLLYAGLNPDYNLGAPSVRWGDYSHVQLDPTDPTVFWTFTEVNGAKQVNSLGQLRPRWSTVITKIVLH